jgi:hypothetical protein
MALCAYILRDKIDSRRAVVALPEVLLKDWE